MTIKQLGKLISTNRNGIIREVFTRLKWDGQMRKFLDGRVTSPVTEGNENYTRKTDPGRNDNPCRDSRSNQTLHAFRVADE